MRRVRRKDTIFRVYLFSLLILCILGVWWLLSMQARYHRSRMSVLESRISDLENRLIEVSSVSSSASTVSDDTPSNPILSKVVQEREKLFWVEGHGYNKRYAYLDLEFKDGYRARYYFRPFPSRSELVSLHRRIEHDALSHYFDPLSDPDDFS